MNWLKLNQLKLPESYHSQVIMDTNNHSQQYGLILTQADTVRIIASVDETLRNLGRIELSNQLIPAIINAFASSPYIRQDEYTDVLCQLLECFYYLKNESRELISDDDLIQLMRNAFDQGCHGAAELLAEQVLMILNQES